MSDLADDDAEEVIRQFAEITETDEAFAHFILQDVNYDLERALSRYYSVDSPEAAYQQFQTDNWDSADTLSQQAGSEVDEEGGTSNDQQKGKQQPPRKRSRPADQPTAVESAEFPAELTLLTWNVDGMGGRNVDQRFYAVLYTIARTNPEMIFLQEMTHTLMPKLADLMTPMYNIVVADVNNPEYFCVTLISKNIKVSHSEVIPFPNTGMGRSMTVVQGQWQRLRLVLMNTHLESTRQGGEVRKEQFKQCMAKVRTMIGTDGEETLAVFGQFLVNAPLLPLKLMSPILIYGSGGDLNIRDKEVAEIGTDAAFSLMRDAWEAAGSNANSRFTWDMCRNDNYSDNGRARCRFDRVYFVGPYEQLEFSLEGTNRIRGPNIFPSDHFAIVCRFVSPRNVPEITQKDKANSVEQLNNTSSSVIVTKMED